MKSFLFLLALVASLCGHSPAADPARPNIVYLVIDNVTFTHMGKAFGGLNVTPAMDSIAVLAGLMAQRDGPAHLRSDNGPELVAKAVEAWLKVQAVGPLYIASENPWENAQVESFNRRLRDEHFIREEFASLLEAQVLAAGWRRDDNEARPHSALGYLAPTVFAGRWRAPVGATPLPAHASAETLKP